MKVAEQLRNYVRIIIQKILRVNYTENFIS